MSCIVSTVEFSLMVRCPGLNTAAYCSIGGLKPAANAVCSIFYQKASFLTDECETGSYQPHPNRKRLITGKDMSPGKGQSMRKDQAKPLKQVRVMQALTRLVASNRINTCYRKIWLRSMIEPRAYLECFRRRDSRLIDRPRRAIFFHGARCPHRGYQ